MDKLLSPFPGMDPYLEEPALWGSVHTRLMNSISDQLAESVAPNFYVDIQQHDTALESGEFYGRHIVPDIYVAERVSLPTAATESAITEPTLVEPLESHEVVERFLEIRDRRSREVVTIIEVLSPFNKAAGQKRRDAFQEKRSKVMASLTNWIEIDLLRAGERPDEVAGKSHYYALLKRSRTLTPYEVWYFDIRDKLPKIAIPLREPFDDVPLDLQAVLVDVYRRARYAENIAYTDPIPAPRLRPADEQWALEQIAKWQNA